MKPEMEEVACQICGQEFEVEKYGQGPCPKCGTEVLYDNDVYRLALSQEQIEVLKNHALQRRVRPPAEASEAEQETP